MSDPAAYPLVTVITPAYNAEAYLRETMECVQAQTWPNLVHLVIENASTDATADIIAEFENARIPVKVVRHETLLPQVENWNSSFEHLPEGTEWFRLLCADDTMAPDAIEKMMQVARQDEQIGLVACKVNYGGERETYKWPEDVSVMDGKEALRRFFLNEGHFRAPHVLVNVKAIPEDGVYFDQCVNAFDTDSVLRTLTKWRFGFVHEYIANTRVHADTVTSRFVAPKRLHLVDWYHYLLRYADIAFPEDNGQTILLHYKRHYLRRLMSIRREDESGKIWEEHMNRLEKLNARPTTVDFIDAMADRLLIAVGIRPKWYAYPW